MAVLPPNRIRILDLGTAWAVPLATRLLAGLGAEIIKVEAFSRPDVTRFGTHPHNEPGEKHWNRGGRFNDLNRNKRDLALDLTRPEGAALFKRLVAISDIVAENFTPRVMKNFGLDYPVLKEVKPDIIMLSSSGYGHSGPWRNYGAYGMGLEPTVGLTHLTGYREGRLIKSGIPYTDVPAATHGTLAILAALEYRRRTGRGQWIDLSQYEVSLAFIGEALMDYVMNGRLQGPLGNAHPFLAPHGCYRCQGEDSWVTIAVTNDEEWQGLCQALGRPAWAKEARFSDALSRWQNQDELDRLLEVWTSQRDHYDVMHQLQKEGVPAGAVLNPKEVLLDPHLKARRAFELVDHPPPTGVGRRPHLAVPWKMSRTQGRLQQPAPTLGQDNEWVLTELLGLPEAERTRLSEARVVSREPIPRPAARSEQPPAQQLEQGNIVAYDDNFEEILDLK